MGAIDRLRPWSRKRPQGSFGVVAPVFLIRERSPNSCLGLRKRRARIRKDGPIRERRETDLESSTQGIYAGIDVSKGYLDVFVHPVGDRFGVPNDASGIDTLVARLNEEGRPALVVLEATGSFEHPAAAALAASGLAVAVVNPRQARDFARATGVGSPRPTH